MSSNGARAADPDERDALLREIRSRHPRFGEAVLADARVTAAYRGETLDTGSAVRAATGILRLIWVSDAFIGQVLYRAKARMQALGIPVLPRLAHRLAMATTQIAIGDPVVVQPGVYILHGQVVIDGITTIASGVTIAPFVTVGLRAGEPVGPTIEENVSLGTGAKVIGPITVGSSACVGANSVVVSDIDPWTVAVGAPARPRSDDC